MRLVGLQSVRSIVIGHILRRLQLSQILTVITDDRITKTLTAQARFAVEEVWRNEL